ncbi:small ubiquitin-related modifier 2-like [Sorex araneus]|uniref:small ubiquitin-related modifier 2-like n=1 Tax=Sorex araneus TaxID=42254 RepID=UPI00033186AA|nr:small ubiquitin-related modifier 2-like [Sorex araneus]
MANEKPKGGVKTENNNNINLKVAGQDAPVLQFKIKRHTPFCITRLCPPLSKLMKASCERQDLSMKQIRFQLDRQPVNETDTRALLEMEDEDAVDVFQQQTGGVDSRSLLLSAGTQLLQTKKTFATRKPQFGSSTS